MLEDREAAPRSRGVAPCEVQGISQGFDSSRIQGLINARTSAISLLSVVLFHQPLALRNLGRPYTCALELPEKLDWFRISILLVQLGPEICSDTPNVGVS